MQQCIEWVDLQSESRVGGGGYAGVVAEVVQVLGRIDGDRAGRQGRSISIR